MSVSVVPEDKDKPEQVSTRKGVHWSSIAYNVAWRVYHHARKHTGVGIVCSVAYFDPGNWGVDLQAGSQFGYSLLFCVLLAGLLAALLQVSFVTAAGIIAFIRDTFWQVLASRLGVVTGLDLASHCRLLLHDRPRHKMLWRWGVLYPLYVLSEIAIISTDLAEMLGSAIALVLLFPSLPLWAGVLLTASDVMLLLAFDNPLRTRPVKMFEYLITALTLAVLICMAIIIARINVDWADVFKGLLPSKALFENGALYTTVGILGATIMPHSLFLGSHLATQDRMAEAPLKEVHTHSESASFEPPQDKTFLQRLYHFVKQPLNVFSCDGLPEDNADYEPTTNTRHATFSERLRIHCRRLFGVFRSEESYYPANVLTHANRENNPLPFVRAHVYHGMVDMIISLLGFAVIINALILVLASAVFYYGSGARGSMAPASLFDAHTLIRDTIGRPAALLFALALLASGQSASVIATLAGQSVSEGFLHWKVSPILRRLITRLLGLVPSMIVAIAVGPNGINALLVASQVVLSIILPFITFPLIYLTSTSRFMKVRKSSQPSSSDGTMPPHTDVAEADPPALEATPRDTRETPRDPETADQAEYVDFSSGKIVTAAGTLTWLIIVSANVYALVTLGQGN
ncbi:smf Mn2+ and Fe2+ transporter [Pisolithus orientalis]|uniref:smf Mn2+ and Fe2+ transporter n=1 Tax=Pisolithus orientalis TaxID=936130 RepID=UPI0022257C98|nr:smf Mn2+ and Fe2+ transporter [Pisolithus orientalis]KAI6012578.1 smf Mn2+ and Fe2+ transporter [Pisolithus orientalis]